MVAAVARRKEEALIQLEEVTQLSNREVKKHKGENRGENVFKTFFLLFCPLKL